MMAANEQDAIEVVALFGSGTYEIGITCERGATTVQVVDRFWRSQTSLGPTPWRYFEPGDGALEDAMTEIIKLSLSA